MDAASLLHYPRDRRQRYALVVVVAILLGSLALLAYAASTGVLTTGQSHDAQLLAPFRWWAEELA